MQRNAPGGWVLVISVEPGILAGATSEIKEQQVTHVWISEGEPRWDFPLQPCSPSPSMPSDDTPFWVLDDITASELLRDLAYLRG